MDQSRERLFILAAGKGQFDGRVMYCRVDDCIAQFHGTNTLLGGREQRLAFEDGIGKILENTCVLLAFLHNGNRGMPHFRLTKSKGSLPAEAAHLNFIARIRQGSTFHDELALFAGHFETVGSGGFSGCCDEDTRAAVFIFHVGGHAVLHFDIVIAAKLTEAAHLFGHAKDPLEQIEIVRALIEQHSAAFPLPCGTPSTRGIVGMCAEPIGDDPVDALNFSQLSSLNHAADLLINGIRSLVEHGREDLIRIAVGRDESFAIGFMR